MLGSSTRVEARILFVSTNESYGNPEINPQPEKYNINLYPIKIRSFYNEGKCVAELLFYNYIKMHDIEIRIKRIYIKYLWN